MKLNKLIAFVLSFLFCLSAVLGTAAAEEPVLNKKLSIVTTIFPICDWVREVLGDRLNNVDLTMLLDNGTDLHSYQPTAQDIVRVSNADLFIYVGGESDEWVEDVLASAMNPNLKSINLVEAMGEDIKLEEIVEGMQHEHEHEHDNEIEAEDIENRSLAEFAGEWKSLEPMANNGELDAFFAHEAEEEGVSLDEARNEFVAKRACDAVSLKVEGDTIAFTMADGTTCSAAYTYAGYTPVLADDGDIKAVRYQFTASSDDAPKYVQFNDHGYKPADEVEHFHFYLGNESFEALLNAESNSFFVPADWSATEIMGELTGHGGHDHDHEHHHDHEEETDEHVWLSLRNAEKLVQVIANTLAEIDSANAATYQANAAAYIQKLDALDAQYVQMVEAASVKTVLFGDRFPFRYLVDDYGLNYYAAFSGCSAESEASFATVVFLAQKVNELNLPAVLTIEGANHRIAETVIGTSSQKDAKVLAMDSMQSTTSAQMAEGATYLGTMENNLNVLREALN